MLLLAGCANAPGTLSVGGWPADAGVTPPVGGTCVSHAECGDGQICLYEGATGHCAPPCTLTGTCPTGPAAGDDGAACAADTDCAGGVCLGPELGYPGGACTTPSCAATTDCHGASPICLAASSGSTYCGAACGADTDCREGYRCHVVSNRGYCAPKPANTPATPDAGIPEPPDAAAPPTEPPAPPTEPPPPPVTAESHEFCQEVNEEQNYFSNGLNRYTVTFDVPEGAYSFQVQIGAQNGFGGFESLEGPINVNFLNEYPWVNGLIYPGTTLNAVQMPHRPDLVGSKIDGTYTLHMGSTEVPFCPVVMSKQVAGRKLDVNLILAVGNGVPDAADAPQNAQLQTVVRSAQAIYQQAGIDLEIVRYTNMAPDVQQRFAILRDENELQALFQTTTAPGNDIDSALSLNLIMVQQILIANGNVLGVSGGIPGLAGVHGWQASGVVMTAAVLGDPGIGSETVAHEMGHFLGLFHTTEIDGSMADPLDDTPVCPANGWTQPDVLCPDAQNLMFPYAHAGTASITLDQNSMLHTSPLIK